MALEAGEGLSREQLRRAFALTHNGYLVLNNEIAQRLDCFGSAIGAWRRARDKWAAFYAQGWSASRYDEMLQYRMQLFRWRKLFLETCEIAEGDVPLYATL